MGAFSDRLTATALRLLTNYGQAIYCHKINTAAFDPETGEAAVLGRTDYDGQGYPSNYNRFQVDGVTILQGDILLILSTTTLPEVNDICEVSGTTYTMLNIQRITAQGNDVVYKIQLRQ